MKKNIALLAGGVVSIGALLAVERRVAAPVLDLTLFRNVGFAGANTVMLLVGLAMFGVFFYVSLYVQNVLGYSPVQAGASFLPWTLLIILLAPRAGKLSDRIGPRPLVGFGMVVLAGSLVLFSRMGVDESFGGLLPAMLSTGHVYGVPLAFKSVALWRNLRRVPKPPTTLDESAMTPVSPATPHPADGGRGHTGERPEPPRGHG